jgi:membrane protease YdiL (CAAX protease family)
MIILGLTAGLIGGFFEEIGWTGFALPKLQLVFTPFKAAIILGVVHTFWHLLADWWGGIHFYKELYVLHFLLWIPGLVALRLLITVIYNNTGSLLLAQLTHASFTGSQLMFSPSALNATESIQWYLVFIAVLWAIVAAALINRLSWGGV